MKKMQRKPLFFIMKWVINETVPYLDYNLMIYLRGKFLPMKIPRAIYGGKKNFLKKNIISIFFMIFHVFSWMWREYFNGIFYFLKPFFPFRIFRIGCLLQFRSTWWVIISVSNFIDRMIHSKSSSCYKLIFIGTVYHFF